MGYAALSTTHWAIQVTLDDASGPQGLYVGATNLVPTLGAAGGVAQERLGQLHALGGLEEQIEHADPIPGAAHPGVATTARHAASTSGTGACGRARARSSSSARARPRPDQAATRPSAASAVERGPRRASTGPGAYGHAPETVPVTPGPTATPETWAPDPTTPDGEPDSPAFDFRFEFDANQSLRGHQEIAKPERRSSRDLGDIASPNDRLVVLKGCVEKLGYVPDSIRSQFP